MKTVTIRLALSCVAVGFGAGRLPGQDLVPPPKTMLLVPAVHYEPARPQPLPSSAVRPAAYQEPVAPEASAPEVDFTAPADEAVYQFWARFDYLNWWISRAPVGVPLVTAAAPPGIGALGQPGTTVLFGGDSSQSPSFGTIPGGHFTIGGWLERGYSYGWEFSGLFLQRRDAVFSATSPNVAIPFNATVPFNGNPAGETSLNSAGAPSNATVHLTSQLWGLDLNELVYICANESGYVTGVLGVRYLNLTENLTLTHTSLDVTNNGTLAVTDGFGTRNQFFAAQIGARTGCTVGRFTLDASALVLFGPMYQIVNVAGGTTVSGGAFGFADTTTKAGILAEPSNIGMVHQTASAVGADCQLKVGYAVTRWFQPFIAYNGLFVNHVARPGNQIDHYVDPTQNAFFVPPGTTGAAAPVTNIQSSPFWAHGVQIGMELRY